MSEYPKLANGPGWECQVCGEFWEWRYEAAECCPPLPKDDVWLCGEEQCYSGVHRTREQAEECVQVDMRAQDCVCGHLLRHHGVAQHPGCYSPGCKCMAPELPE